MLVVFNQMNKARIGCGSTSAAMKGRGKRQSCFITAYFSPQWLFLAEYLHLKSDLKPSIALDQSEQQRSELHLLLLYESRFVTSCSLCCTVALAGTDGWMRTGHGFQYNWGPE